MSWSIDIRWQKTGALLLCFILPMIIKSQVDLSLFNDQLPFETEEWSTPDPTNDKLKFPNGKIRVEYFHKNDSIYTRQEYFENGDIKSSSEVYRREITLIRYIEDLETGEKTAVKRIYFGDVCHGKSQVFDINNHLEVISKGEYRNNMKYGEWMNRVDPYYKVISHYNEQGMPDGKFQQYFIYEHLPPMLIWEGEYSIVEYHETRMDWDGYRSPPVTDLKKESRRSGIWKHYNMAGELLESVQYQWLKD